MWIYEQRSGALRNLEHMPNRIEIGYSGHGAGKNNPDAERTPFVGPIPRGLWHIGPPECVDKPGKHGPYILRLTPEPGTETFGRDGFLIHGDAVLAPGTASEGCIILPRTIRSLIAQSGDTHLHVV